MLNKQNWNSNTKSKAKGKPPKVSLPVFEAVRVKDIVLDENHPRFNEVGGWSGIGTIFFQKAKTTFDFTLSPAKPFFPQMKSPPIEEELVLIVRLPSTDNNTSITGDINYYISPLSLWNHPHYNGFPNLNDISIHPKDNLKSSYQTTSEGNPNTPNESITPSTPGFSERGDLRPLLPFCGDNLYEGRFGNSIRIGNTSKSKSQFKNNWSEGPQTKEGDPIIIIRNGQRENEEVGFIPITEDVNRDMSSLYFTSTQKLPFEKNIEDKFNQKTNWKYRPISPKSFDKSQIIGNSDRIILNAKTDSMLLGAEKSINLSCLEDVNINSRNVYADFQNIKLGGKNATEPLIKGEVFLDNLKVVLDNLETLCDALQTSNLWPEGVPVPNNPVITTSANLKSSIESFVNQLGSYKSNVSKTI